MSAEGIVWNQDDSRAEIISHKDYKQTEMVPNRKAFQEQSVCVCKIYVLWIQCWQLTWV